MTQGRGNKANDLLQPNFRGDALHGNAPSGPTRPFLGQKAQLSSKLISDASKVFDADELEEFASVIMRGTW